MFPKPHIDEKLATFFPSVATADCQHLGFNPMRITAAGPLGHIESAGLLRDIFASIFPDLGDLQLETLRAAIKSSYEELGWGSTVGTPSVPKFRAFLEKLLDAGRSDARTQTLLARLTELDDFASSVTQAIAPACWTRGVRQFCKSIRQ